jgi:hypothetical protein
MKHFGHPQYTWIRLKVLGSAMEQLGQPKVFGSAIEHLVQPQGTWVSHEIPWSAFWNLGQKYNTWVSLMVLGSELKQLGHPQGMCVITWVS